MTVVELRRGVSHNNLYVGPVVAMHRLSASSTHRVHTDDYLDHSTLNSVCEA